jgi:glutamyl-Q tRNA(Asp) synthetase
LGALVAALASYADARAAGGEWRLRIDDVDVARARGDAADEIVATLARHGFAWDGAIARQSARIERYDAAFAMLLRQGALYPCRCTRSDLADARLSAAGERVYPGRCRERGVDPGAGAVAWRVRVGDAVVAFDDRVQGRVTQSLAGEVGDFVVKRNDGLYAYQLAVVVDDADDAITDVVRGADLLASTPRQMLLQRLLGLATPRYLHVPVAINARGDKLAKQTGARALDADPAVALAAAWRFLGQALPESRRNSPAEFWEFAIRAWSPARIPCATLAPCPPGYA